MAEQTVETTDQLSIRFNDQGLVPAIVQDVDSGAGNSRAACNALSGRSTPSKNICGNGLADWYCDANIGRRSVQDAKSIILATAAVSTKFFTSFMGRAHGGVGGYRRVKLRDRSAKNQSRDRVDVFHSARGKGMILPDDTISDDTPIHAGL